MMDFLPPSVHNYPMVDDFDAVHAAQELGNLQQEEVSTEEYIRTLETEIEGLNSLLAQKELIAVRATKQSNEALNEIERIKLRLQTEAAQQVETRVAVVIGEMLDVGDDLARAIQSAHTMDHNPAVIEGVELVRQSFGRRLEKLGVTRTIALGARFDPNLHEAVSIMPVEDPAQDGVVLAVLQEGYRLHDNLLREAKVAVGKLY